MAEKAGGLKKLFNEEFHNATLCLIFLGQLNQGI
jgi:hypothetical protein